MQQKPAWMTSIDETRLDLEGQAARLEMLTIWRISASRPPCQQQNPGFCMAMIEEFPGGWSRVVLVLQ